MISTFILAEALQSERIVTPPGKPTLTAAILNERFGRPVVLATELLNLPRTSFDGERANEKEWEER